MHATKDAVVIVVVPSRWVFNGVVGILVFVHEGTGHEAEAGEATSYSSEAGTEGGEAPEGGSLASDEALQALREKLTGGTA